MDPGKDIAEERLLRVIEKGQSRSSAVAVSGAFPGNLFKWLRSGFSKNYARPIGREVDPVLRGIRWISVALWIAIGVSAVYFLAGLFAPDKVTLQNRILERGKAAASAARVPASEDIAGQLKPQSYYTEAMQNPNPFTGVSEELPQVIQEEKGPSAKDKLASMTKGLSVVGINRGPVPDAIVEDADQKRTFFVKVGDSINDMTVKEIKRDSVVLRFEAEEIEIA
jgi:hypothetical protein